MKKEIVGIIPARGGSKGIPRKNIRKIFKKPLIAWTIEAALDSHVVSRVIVSTDDEDIAIVAEDAGAEVPFMRPAELSSDSATSYSVVEHVIEWLDKNEGYQPGSTILLQPTSPLRTHEDIRASVAIFQTHDAPAVVSVCPVTQHPFLMKTINNDGTLSNFLPDIPHVTRRQNMPAVFVVNGAVYLNKWSVLMREETFMPRGTLAYIMPEERSVDIDTPLDFMVAEQILQKKQVW